MESPFQTVLGDKFGVLPEAVRNVHALRISLHTEGLADVCVSPGFWPWLICWITGLPKSGCEVPTAVSFLIDEPGEQWKRRFADRRYESTMVAKRRKTGWELVERLNWFSLMFDLSPNPNTLKWTLKCWSFRGIPLPKWTKPSIECVESGSGQRFLFDINVAFPLVGRVIEYRGWLLPKRGNP